jgi:hypothetical protein
LDWIQDSRTNINSNADNDVKESINFGTENQYAGFILYVDFIAICKCLLHYVAFTYGSSNDTGVSSQCNGVE